MTLPWIICYNLTPKERGSEIRYLFVFLISLSLLLGGFSAPSPAQRKIPPGQVKKIERIRERIEKLSPEERKEAVKALNAKLQRLRQRNKMIRQARERALLRDEIEQAEKELELLQELREAPAPPRPSIPPGQVMPPGQRMIPPGQIRMLPGLVRPMPRPRSPQVGLSAGYLGGLPGAVGELRFFEPFNLVSTSLRVGAAYAKGEDSAGNMRQHAVLVLDGIYHLNPPHSPGLRSYFGLGFNYNAYTTGRVSGTVGGGVFYGVEGDTGLGQMFFEVGYGLIRTGFSPAYKGLTALLGYKF